MWLDELELEKVSALSRTPKAEVISQIITDMEFAASNLPHHWELKIRDVLQMVCQSYAITYLSTRKSMAKSL